MAENRTINIDINQNADEAAKGFNKLNDSLDETNKSIRDVNATFEQVYGDLQPLTTRLGEAEDRLYELAAAGQQTSQEYQDLLETVANYRKIQIQTDAIVDGASQTLTQKLGSALNGVSSGFATTQGAIALFGDENEQLEKTLLKVQSALAIQQGIQGLQESYKQLNIGTRLATTAQGLFAAVTGTTSGALKVLRIALASTGIGLLVAGLGLLVANFDKVWNVIKQGIDIALVPLKSALDVVVDSYYAVTDALGITSKEEREKEKQAKQIATEEQKRAAERKRQYEELKKQIDESVGKIERLQFARKKAYDDEIALLQASGKETARVERQKLKDIVETQKEILKERMKQEDFFAKLYAKNQVEQAEFQLKLFDAKIGKELSDKQKDYANKRRELLRQIQDEEIKQIEDQSQREQTQLIVSADRRIEDIKKSEGDAKLKAKLIKEVQETLLMELEELDKKYYEKQKAEEAKRRDESINIKAKTIADIYKKEESAQTALLSLYGLGLQKQIEAEQEAAAKRKALIEGTVRVTLQGLDLIASIAEANAGKDEKRQRAAFNVRKASNIAQATVDGYKAVLSTYADTPGGPIIKGIAATLAGAFAALKISQIAKSKYQSSSGGGGGSDLASGVPTSTPQFNTIGSSGINQLAQLQQQPVQAYVVSGEVTSAQALDRNRIQNATL